MRQVLAAMAIVLGLSGAAWAQEKGKERKEGKDGKESSIALKDIDTNSDGRASVSELQAAINKLTGNREGGKEGKEKSKEGEKRREEGSIPLNNVDTNNDGRATMPELQAALEKASKGGGDKKEGGEKKEEKKK
jgi:5-hydroxyisourate hydrolase-like protein (transthyretin family)